MSECVGEVARDPEAPLGALGHELEPLGPAVDQSLQRQQGRLAAGDRGVEHGTVVGLPAGVVHDHQVVGIGVVRSGAGLEHLVGQPGGGPLGVGRRRKVRRRRRRLGFLGLHGRHGRLPFLGCQGEGQEPRREHQDGKGRDCNRSLHGDGNLPHPGAWREAEAAQTLRPPHDRATSSFYQNLVPRENDFLRRTDGPWRLRQEPAERKEIPDAGNPQDDGRWRWRRSWSSGSWRPPPWRRGRGTTGCGPPDRRRSPRCGSSVRASSTGSAWAPKRAPATAWSGSPPQGVGTMDPDGTPTAAGGGTMDPDGSPTAPGGVGMDPNG